MKMDFFQQWHEHGTKKNSESPTGIEPMASQIPVGPNHIVLAVDLLQVVKTKDVIESLYLPVWYI